MFVLSDDQRRDLFKGIRLTKFCGVSCQLTHTQRTYAAQIGRDNRHKIRAARLARNVGTEHSYPKLYGRHEHRVVAEQLLGRALLPGEVVHHKDHNKRNNDPSNLEVLDSQSEHCRLHGFGNNHD